MTVEQPQEPQPEEASAETLASEVIAAMMKGAPKASIIDWLISLGATPSVAAAFVDGAKTAVVAQARRRMLYGVLWMVGGGLITLVTYAAAEPGGTYIVVWGAMLWGGWEFLRWLLRYVRWSAY